MDELKEQNDHYKPAKKPRRSRAPHDAQAVLKVGSDYYILASSVSHRPNRTLAAGEAFAVLETGGDFVHSPLGSGGLFYRDARHLSRMEMRVAGRPAIVLNSYLSHDNAELCVNLTNPDLYRERGTVWLPRGSVHIERSWALSGGTLFGRVRLRNFSRLRVLLEIRFLLGADFADLFEVRGVKRAVRGEMLEPAINQDSIRFCYRGLDAQTRVTTITFAPAPETIDHGCALFPVRLEPEQSVEVDLRVECTWEAPSAARAHHVFDIHGALAA